MSAWRTQSGKFECFPPLAHDVLRSRTNRSMIAHDEASRSFTGGRDVIRYLHQWAHRLQAQQRGLISIASRLLPIGLESRSTVRGRSSRR